MVERNLYEYKSIKLHCIEQTITLNVKLGNEKSLLMEIGYHLLLSHPSQMSNDILCQLFAIISDIQDREKCKCFALSEPYI